MRNFPVVDHIFRAQGDPYSADNSIMIPVDSQLRILLWLQQAGSHIDLSL
jgi:hypothetical protein